MSSEARLVVVRLPLLDCFKPCCNGLSSEAPTGGGMVAAWVAGFKPCCNGLSSEAVSAEMVYETDEFVSNLVVMD